MFVSTRLRQRSLPDAKTTFGNKHGQKLTSGYKLGVFKEYNPDGSLRDSVNMNLTGSLDPSVMTERMWDEVHPGPPFYDGGNMAKVKVRAPFSGTFGGGIYSSRGNPDLSGAARVEYHGVFAPGGFHPSGLPYQNYVSMGPEAPWMIEGFPNLSSYALQAWDLIRPRIEKAGGGQFLGELRDLPGMLKTSCQGFRKLWLGFGGREDRLFMHPKDAADHFLNHNFGWVPFINDLIKFYDVYQNSEQYIRDAIRNNGSWIKRMRRVTTTNVDTVDYQAYGNYMSPAFSDNRIFHLQQDGSQIFSSRFTSRSRIQKKVWAMGKFYQYRPEFDPILLAKFPSDWSKTKQLLLLYGVRINPDVLWKITPWTWLVDWFVSVGRNIDIWTKSVEDSIAAKYAYLMCTEERQVIETFTNYFWSGTVNFNRIYSIESKVRNEMASPYGFNYGWDELSAKQLGILGALGISRTHHR